MQGGKEMLDRDWEKIQKCLLALKMEEGGHIPRKEGHF